MFSTNRIGALLVFARAFAVAVALCAPLGALAQSAHELQVTQLKPDIYFLQRPNAMRIPVEGNILVIVNEEDVVVVDAGGYPVTAENAIKRIREITPKPVSVLINTHWHGDHNYGNQTWRKHFPGVRIVAHENTYRGITMPFNVDQTKRLPKTLEDYLSGLRDLKAKGDWNDRRELLLNDVTFLIADGRADIRLTPPDLTFTDSLLLRRGEREIHVQFIGRANTDGDAIVWLPKEKILATGDIVVHPIPYGFGSYPRDWIETLGKIRALPWEILVPGHGELQRDPSYLLLLERTLASLREQAAAAVAKGLDLEGFRKTLDVSALESEFVREDRLKKSLLDAFWITPITKSAWLEASGKPILQSEIEVN